MGGFSKTSYRANRNKGKRGQGEKFSASRLLEDGKGGHMVRGPRGLQTVNRKQARQKLRSRYYEPTREVLEGFEEFADGRPNLKKPIKRKIEDKVGRPYTRKGVKHMEGLPKYTGPTFDPTVSNHERVFRQRIKSKRIRIDQGDQSNGK